MNRAALSYRALALLAVLADAPGCGPQRHLLGLVGDDAALPDAGTPDLRISDGPRLPTVAELWSELVAVTCEKMQACCTDDEKVRNALAADLQFCQGELTNVRKGLAQIKADRVAESIRRGRAAYHAALAPVCLARLRMLGCGDARASRELACEEVIEPMVALGEPCATSSHHECIEGYCATVSCAARKAAGDKCDESEECASRYCTGNGSGGVCTSPVGRIDDLCAP